MGWPIVMLSRNPMPKRPPKILPPPARHDTVTEYEASYIHTYIAYVVVFRHQNLGIEKRRFLITNSALNLSFCAIVAWKGPHNGHVHPCTSIDDLLV